MGKAPFRRSTASVTVVLPSDSSAAGGAAPVQLLCSLLHCVYVYMVYLSLKALLLLLLYHQPPRHRPPPPFVRPPLFSVTSQLE